MTASVNSELVEAAGEDVAELKSDDGGGGSSTQEMVSTPVSWMYSLFLVVFGILVIQALVSVLPPAIDASLSENPPNDIQVGFLFGAWNVTIDGAEQRLMVVVVIAALAGSYARVASLYRRRTYKGLKRGQIARDMSRFVSGVAVALIVYIALRAGLLAPASDSADVASPVGFAAVGALAGMFSPEATDALGRLAGVLLPASRKT
jgi:hypothetical protein